MKLAIVHDYLVQMGGAEKVLKVMHDIWPKAPIYALFYDQRNLSLIFPKDYIRTSFLQKFPHILKHYQWYLAFMPAATESYNLSEYEIVISSSSAYSKGIIVHPNTLHFCYCHTPTRYLWSDAQQYVEDLPYPKTIKKFLPLVLNRHRIFDQMSAQRVDFFIANSQFVAKRIKKYYRRSSIVIYPPVETSQFFISPHTEKYFLTGGRLVPYKRFDLAITTCNQLGVSLKVFGSGPQLGQLKKMAKTNIEFLERVTPLELAQLYSRCIAFINPQIEDFGITAVEAMASGRPVIAYKRGGILETVLPQITGEFFEEQSWEALADSIVRFKPENYNPQKIKEHAEKFNTERFKKEMMQYVTTQYERRYKEL